MTKRVGENKISSFIKILNNLFNPFRSLFYGWNGISKMPIFWKLNPDSDNKDDISQLDNSGEVSSQTSSDQEDCIKGNCNCHPKTINVISQDQELVLDILRKIEDEKTKQDLYEVFKKSIVKLEVKKTVNPYNPNQIF